MKSAKIGLEKRILTLNYYAKTPPLPKQKEYKRLPMLLWCFTDYVTQPTYLLFLKKSDTAATALYTNTVSRRAGALPCLLP